MFVITEIMVVTIVMTAFLIGNFGIKLSESKVYIRKKALFVGLLLGVGVPLILLIMSNIKNSLIIIEMNNSLLIFLIFANVSQHVFLWSLYFRLKNREEYP